MHLLLSRLDEQQRRWYVAVESNRIGSGGDRLLSQITGLDEKAIQRGREELAHSLAERPAERVRLPGAGRPRAEKTIRMHNRGAVYVGSSADTAQFAVTALRRWWEEEGRVSYPEAKQILILADSGDSNGCRLHLWKQQLQEHLSDRFGLTVVVCHYPTGCSKWNPTEHRLFSYISLNWAGCPLGSFETLLNYIRGTTTRTGPTVRATLLERE